MAPNKQQGGCSVYASSMGEHLKGF